MKRRCKTTQTTTKLLKSNHSFSYKETNLFPHPERTVYAMQLTTQRLSLRSIEYSDLANMHQLHSLKETDEFNTLGIPQDIEETETILNNWITSQDSYIFSVKETVSNEFTGLIALILGKLLFRNAEVWYKTLPQYWGKGYTSEALNEILAFGFSKLKLHRIEAGCAIKNYRSINVLGKAGMKLEGTKRQVLPVRGEWVDSNSYAILDTEFETRLSVNVKL